jgi:myo-inositol-1(or 4)-monophosphatase
VHSWDTAAGALLVEEAGGMMTCAKTGRGYDLTVRSIVGSNGKIHDQLRSLLVSAKAVELDAIEG